MHDIESFDPLRLEVGDEFGPAEWFDLKRYDVGMVYTVRDVSDGILYYRNLYVGNSQCIMNEFLSNPYFQGYRMRKKFKFLEYDPNQQGDLEEDI